MATDTDHYAALGVSSSSDDVVIRAAYKALMLKYHPDTNKSQGATERATAINAAFAVLGDPQRRANYDASRNSQSAPPPPSPPPAPPPPPKGGHRPQQSPAADALTAPPAGWVAKLGGILAVLIVGAVVRVAVHEANRSSSSPTSTLSAAADPMSAMGMDTMTDNMTAVDGTAASTGLPADAAMSNLPEAAADNGLGTFTYQAPTGINFDDIEGASYTFAKVLNQRGIYGARAWSQKCHAEAAKAPTWSAVDRCAAFDFAARYMDAEMVKAANIAPNSYFAFQADNQADSYSVVGGQPYTVAERLKRIRTAVEPTTYEAVMAGIKSREAAAPIQPADQPEANTSGTPTME